jgi:hypothetical protein
MSSGLEKNARSLNNLEMLTLSHFPTDIVEKCKYEVQLYRFLTRIGNAYLTEAFI